MSYAAKYASAFYGPFREAADSCPSQGDRKSHQMDPRNVLEALRETALDMWRKGADIVMVKPALPYLDVIARVRDEFDLPVAAYQVSGEYSMILAAGHERLGGAGALHHGKPDFHKKGRRGHDPYLFRARGGRRSWGASNAVGPMRISPPAAKAPYFKALAGRKLSTAKGRDDAAQALLPVPDERVDRLSAMFQPKKTTYAQVTYLDPPAPRWARPTTPPPSCRRNWPTAMD